MINYKIRFAHEYTHACCFQGMGFKTVSIFPSNTEIKINVGGWVLGQVVLLCMQVFGGRNAYIDTSNE